MDTEELNQRCVDNRSNLQRSEYLDSLVVNDSDQRKNAELKIPELRTSYTTASQCKYVMYKFEIMSLVVSLKNVGHVECLNCLSVSELKKREYESRITRS